MADLVITAADVSASAGATIFSGTAGATITAGQIVYLDGTSDKLKLADADLSQAAAAAVGMALNGASDGQPIDWVASGDVDPGGTVTSGTIYVVSGNAGGLAPSADLASGDWVSIIGVGTTSSNIEFDVSVSGGQL